MPVNGISPAQREVKQRWLKDECWNEGLEKCLTGGMCLGRRTVCTGGTRDEWRSSAKTCMLRNGGRALAQRQGLVIQQE